MANEGLPKMAKILQPYLGHGGSQAECVDKIMGLMTDAKCHDLIAYNENTFKSYFNGRSSINRLARRVAGHLRAERMAQYIDELDYQARSRIAKNLVQVGIKLIRPRLEMRTLENLRKSLMMRHKVKAMQRKSRHCKSNSG